MEATALLLNWKRPNNLKLIVNALRRQSVPVEIFVWNNSPNKIDVDADWVVDSSNNVMCGARWFMANYASCPYVFSLDDDLIPSDCDVIRDCATNMQRADMLGYQGVELLPGRTYRGSKHVRACDEDAYVDIVKGRFLFTGAEVARRSSAAAYVGTVLRDPSVEDDIVLSSFAGRKLIPSVLRRRFRELPAPYSLCGRPDHYDRRQAAVDRYFHG